MSILDQIEITHNYQQEIVDKSFKLWSNMHGALVEVNYPLPETISLSASMRNLDQHYRPYLEKYVGQQSVDWDWSLTGVDILIKLHESKNKYASILKLMWG